MEIRFLTTLIPKELYDEVNAKSTNNMQDAANALQWHLFEGFCANYNTKMPIINVLPVGSYPQYYSDSFVKEKKIITENGCLLHNVGFCNIKLIRKYLLPKRIYNALMKSFNGVDEGILYIYTASAPFLEAVSKLKKHKPGIKTCAIIADLPNMSSLSHNKSVWQKAFEKILAQKAFSRIKCIDAFVLLTKQMADYLEIDKPFCVVEGISTASQEFVSTDLSEPDNTKTIFYSGTLHRRFGVLNLIEAFKRISNPNYRLIICGMGDAEDEIKKASISDARIQFLGQLPRGRVLEIYQTATVLVNPRQNIEEYTKYSFPSKIIEYMSAGKPVVCYKLDGMPDDYDQYLFYVNDNSIQTLADTLVEICELGKEIQFNAGCKGKEFVQRQKNSITQTSKIIEMMNLI